MKKIWSVSLIISLIFTYILASPSLEVYRGIPCPFGTFRDSTSTFFGVEFRGFIQQSILITMSGFLAIMTGLFAFLCITKLQNLPKNQPPLIKKKKIGGSGVNMSNERIGLEDFQCVIKVENEGTVLCSKKQMKIIHEEISNNLNSCLL